MIADVFENGVGFLGWLIGSVIMTAFWILLIVLIVRLVRSPGHGPARTGALRILEERYARGEIDGDEFLERRRVLLGDSETAEPPPR